jgi:hypothetical protein
MFLKRVAEKLGIFYIIANYIECPKLPFEFGRAAVYLNSTLTVLSVEMTEKAVPVLPGILARINSGVENVVADHMWYVGGNEHPNIRTFYYGFVKSDGFPVTFLHPHNKWF